MKADMEMEKDFRNSNCYVVVNLLDCKITSVSKDNLQRQGSALCSC